MVTIWQQHQQQQPRHWTSGSFIIVAKRICVMPPTLEKNQNKNQIKEEEEWTIESYKLSFPWRQCRQKNKRVERVALFFFARFV